MSERSPLRSAVPALALWMLSGAVPVHGTMSPEGEVSSTVVLHPRGEEPQKWKTDFVIHGRNGAPRSERDRSFTQRALSRSPGIGFQVELGDLWFRGTPNAGNDFLVRGGGVTLSGGNREQVRLHAFVAPENDGGTFGVLAGVVGETSLFRRHGSLKTVYLKKKRTYNPEVAVFMDEEASVLGIQAVLDPFEGLMKIETEVDFSETSPWGREQILRDRAYRARVGGTYSGYWYAALYEFTGPDYSLIGSGALRPDSEGVAFSLGKGAPRYTLETRVSLHNDNTADRSDTPRVYRYEGGVDCSLRVLPMLPVGVKYRKTLLESVLLDDGSPLRRSESDTVTATVGYVSAPWDVGIRTSYYQRTDLLSEEREVVATSVGLTPKLTAGDLSLAPDFSLRQSRDFLNSTRTNEYGVSIDLRGKTLDKMLDYQLLGGVTKEITDGGGRDRFEGKMRLGWPLRTLIKSWRDASVGFRGEYSKLKEKNTASGKGNYSLLLLLDSSMLL